MQNSFTQETVVLQVQHTVGRQEETCLTIIKSPEMSRLHAVIFWDGECWMLKDTSTNGTFINGEKQKTGTNQRLNKGDKIHFGSLQTSFWELKEISAPQSMLLPITPGLATITLDKIVALPSPEIPEAILYVNDEGQWMCESQSGTAVLQSGDLVGTTLEKWRFIDSKPSIRTKTIDVNTFTPPNNIKFVFHVSQNEEHVSLTLIVDGEQISLDERSHHYLLLSLARKRLEDKLLNVSEPEQGWIDKDLFSKMLGLQENHINIQIYRFRKQIISILPNAMVLHKAIERRAGELRFAYDNIDIIGGVNCAAR